jgi:Tol biopolymer transport system component
MLTGRQAFGGNTVSDSLAALISREPDWSSLPSHLPPAIRQLLARCLDKDSRTRLRDIGEARVALASAALDTAGDSAIVADRPPAAERRWTERIAWLALIAAVATVLVWRNGQLGRVAASGDTLPSFTMKRLTELPGPELQPNLSPDGRQLLYTSAASGNLDVYLLRVGGDRAINLTANSPLDDLQAAFSPDGERIAFRSERDDGGLFVMGATGESVRRVTDFGFDAAWSPDGKHLVFAAEAVEDPYIRRATTSELWTVALDTGQTARLTETDGVQPAWSPTGERIAYWSATNGQRDIWTVSASGGEPVPVTRDRYTDWSPAWSPDSRSLYWSSDRGGSMNLWRVAIDATTGAVSGDPRPVTAGTRGIGYARLAADGTRMVVMAYDRTADLSLHTIDALLAGDERPQTVLHRQSIGWCSLAPDGAWLACSTKGAQEDIVTLRADGSELRRLTDDVYKDRGAIWTPDGESLIFYSARSGKWDYWWIRIDGSGLRQITSDLGAVAGGAVSPDGSRVAVTAGNGDLIVVDVGKLSTMETATRLLSKDESGSFWRVGGVSWSPDGSRLVVVDTDDAATAHGYALYDFGSGALRTLDVPPAGGFRPVVGWLPDAQRLALRTAEDIVVYDVATGDRRRLIAAGSGASLSRDGRVLVVERDVLDSEIWLLTFE